MSNANNPEPSVLDYLKGRLFPRRSPSVVIPEFESAERDSGHLVDDGGQVQVTSFTNRRFFWILILAVALSLIGQRLLEPPNRSILISVIFYSCAIILIVWNWYRGRFDVSIDPHPEELKPEHHNYFNPIFLAISIGAGLLAIFFFKNNQFTQINLGIWIVSIIFLFLAFLHPVQWKRVEDFFKSIEQAVVKDGLRLHITPWTMGLLAVFVVVTFFRFYRLDQVPLEMISDHAEKLLDVNDVLSGKLSIFFPRNTGREAFQMYLSALVSIVFGTGISFLTLKIGTALMGLMTAVYMYYLGKETGNRWVGLFAFMLCGIGYWPNVISRIGLRFTLYSAFTAPALYYFFKGMRRKRWIDLIFSGLFVGLGLQGYSPYRVVPILIVIGVFLYLLHYKNKDDRKFAIIGLVVIGFTALILFLPLLRYMMDQPEMFAYRALTRAGSLERPLPGPAWQIFLANLWLAVTMFFYQNGTIWVHSIPLRPALDVVTAVLFLVGLVVGTLRYLRQRDWRIPFLVFSIPFLMLPSILSLAFPDENPCLNRTAGALVPVFLFAAFGLESLLKNISNHASGWRGNFAAIFIGGILLLTSVFQNYNLVFEEYDKNYISNSLNTSQIGAVIRDFVDVYGDPDSAYVVGYPYWVDTRLIGMSAGFSTKDYAIWPEKFPDTKLNKQAKLFILNPEDIKDLELLRKLYPSYYETTYKGWLPTKNFIGFLVPPDINSSDEVGKNPP